MKSNSADITFPELDWITFLQSNFTRLEESILIKLGRMLDAGSINIGCLSILDQIFILLMKYQEEKKIFFWDRIHSLNIFLFLGFNLSLISILGFILFKSSIENVV